MSKGEIFDLCDELWRSEYMEESFIACNWSYLLRKYYVPRDFQVFERWANDYVSNWASCDTLCNHTIGSFLEMYPDHLTKLETWCRSPNRWMRRASAVSLIVPARQAKFLNDIIISNMKLLNLKNFIRYAQNFSTNCCKYISIDYNLIIITFVQNRDAIIYKSGGT